MSRLSRSTFARLTFPTSVPTVADQLDAAHLTWKAYMQDMGNDPTRESAVCGHLHRVEQRCCRWLLMTRDRMPSGDFLLTHEFLGMMLGVRRTTVTDVMGDLTSAIDSVSTVVTANLERSESAAASIRDTLEIVESVAASGVKG